MVWYWTGSAWSLLPNQTEWVSVGGQFMTISGSYVEDAPVTVLMIQVNVTTDVLGVFEVLTAADLAGMSGVLALNIQETGPVAWKAMANPGTGKVLGTAYRMTDGSLMAGSPVTAVVQAIMY